MTTADKFGIAFSIGFTIALVAFALSFSGLSKASTTATPSVITPTQPTTTNPAPAAAPAPTPAPAPAPASPAPAPAPTPAPAAPVEKKPAMEEKTAPMTVAVTIAKGASTPGCDEKQECFNPYTANVGVGGTVTWTNSDTAAHTVTSGTATDGPDGTFDSSIITPGKTFSNTFDKAGSYDYFCVVHPWMTGKVVVG